MVPKPPISKEAVRDQVRVETFIVIAFVCLQLLDFASTLVGFAAGAGEANPLLAALMRLGGSPVRGLAASKLIAFGLAALCLELGRVRIIWFFNFWSAALFAWNLANIIKLRT